jgi:hypothetical protein
MDKVVIAKLGVEGGGVTIFGHRVDGVWSFWQQGTAMYLDENDDEDWRSWTTEPVPELPLALPEEWSMMYPSEVHPEFVEQFRREYERCLAMQDRGRAMRSQHERWQELLGICPPRRRRADDRH